MAGKKLIKNNNQISKNLWIAGGYYVDFDEMNQFRIIGPNNHLYCGLIDIPRHKIKIESVKDKKNILEIKGYFIGKNINLYYPAMDDIRTVRNLTKNACSFLEIRNQYFNKMVPKKIKLENAKKGSSIIFKRSYEENLYYQTIFNFPNNILVEKIKKPFKGFKISARTEKKIKFIISAETNDLNPKEFKDFFLLKSDFFDFKKFGEHSKAIKKIWQKAEKEIIHLITWSKTSGDNFGTIFPRDWMESADLGIHDLRPEIISYMYEASLKNVNQKGEGWHEDVVGEYKYEHEISGKDILDRHMIDIEPHYIIGLKYLPSDFLVNKKNREKIKRTAKYLVEQARKNDFIIFKKLPKKLQTKDLKYYHSGNWRDSGWAFKKISQIIAPFDVNCVFYPEALKILKKFQKKLGLKIKDIDKLIKKWESKKKYYSFKNSDGKSAYALAVYGIENKKGKLEYKKMKVNHLDESYLFTYNNGTQADIKSFCQRLLDSNYFYTPSGPMLNAKNNKYGYTSNEYHGLVIWTKQTAFVILGLSKYLKKSIVEEWPKDLQKLIKKTILRISEDTIKTFDGLDYIPEVHWDDNGTPLLYSDQPNMKMPVSEVQLWSAIGARRIIRKYYELLTDPKYKKI
jgi:hypothetical protein